MNTSCYRPRTPLTTSWRGPKSSHPGTVATRMCGVECTRVPRSQSRYCGFTPGQIFPGWKGCGFMSFFHPPCADESGIELLSRSGVVEATRTPEPVTAGRGDQIFVRVVDGFRVDGIRYNHGLYHCISRDQSAKTGMHSPRILK